MEVCDIDRFEVFCETLYPKETGILADMEAYARENDVPIIRAGTRRYLRWLLTTIRPKSILELGTAIGFSAILMAETLKDVGIETIENYEPRIPIAEKNISLAGVSDRVRLIRGDAAEVLRSAKADGSHEVPKSDDASEPGRLSRPADGSLHIPEGGFDFVFIDAAKAQYETYLELTLPMVHGGSVLVFDNVLAQDSGSTMDSRYAIERRDRTIHARMRELLHSVTSDGRFISDLSETGDGILTLTVL